jgi:hypothetical protein
MSRCGFCLKALLPVDRSAQVQSAAAHAAHAANELQLNAHSAP